MPGGVIKSQEKRNPVGFYAFRCIKCVVWPAVPGGVHHVFQVEYEA
jgi:hypothetical protein